MIFFTVVIRLLFHTGVLAGLAAAVSTLLRIDRRWVEFLLTGIIEISSGVTTLAGTGALVGRMSMAAFMLGWAGVSVHCQVLSFLGDSGLSPKTYVMGKLLHGTLSAAGMWLLARIWFPEETVSVYLTEQVETLAYLDFQQALTISTVCAWLVWIGFFIVSVVVVRKNSGKGRKSVIQ